VEGVVDDGEIREVRADEVGRVVGVVGDGVDLPYLAVFVCGQQVGFGEIVDDLLGAFGQGGRAVLGDELDAVVLRRVVRGRHHQRTRQPAVDDRVGDRRRRAVPFGQEHVVAVASQNLGEALGKAGRGFPGVVADDHRIGVPLVVEILRDCFADDPDAAVGEGVQRCAPPVSAEGNLIHTYLLCGSSKR
jgi:hypothetical protein